MNQNQHTPSKNTITPYITGFVLSLICTFAGYFLVSLHLFNKDVTYFSLLLLAVIQLLVQLIFFLHLGRENKPRWQLYFFIGTVLGIILVVGGSLWIMKHLNYNMTPHQMDTEIIKDEMIHKIQH